MRFGTLGFTRAPFEELVARWRWLESLGFDDARAAPRSPTALQASFERIAANRINRR